MRRCGRCGEEKSPDEFAWRRKALGQRDNYCRSCRTAYKHEHYARNKQRYIDSARRRTERIVIERTVYLVSFFREHPCVDCGEGDPIVLEFDHLREKRVGIGKGMRERPWKDVLAEIEKCDVVCANCHRRRTSHRGGFIRSVVLAGTTDEESSGDQGG
jgi:hypothetical protein